MTFVSVVLTLIALALFFIAARYAFFAAIALLDPAPEPPPRLLATRFCVLIPAHNEEAGVADTIRAAQRLSYPPERFRVLVLADNCTDGTADVARAAGAAVVERRDRLLPGKGEAVRWAVANHLTAGEALVIVDADSLPAPDYLQWMDRALGLGYGAAQGFNGAANADASSLATLAAITGAMKNRLHYAGKAAAGLPAPLMNGLTIAAATLHDHPWRAFSVAEDFETYLQLVDDGVPIRFVPQAKILSPKTKNFRDATAQKSRWSGGQSDLALRLALPMAVRAIERRSMERLDAALELLLPGYAPTTALLAVVALLGYFAFATWAHPSTGLALAGLLLMAAQFGVGLTFVRWTPQTLGALLLSPFYIVWKLGLALWSLVRRPTEWRRAARDGDDA
jgi:cellulose synthase/poly-beta-1,6-N-acetylglucosamine synthase-like glycosyltransferase